ncbi:hypothetical protein [Streptomyces yaizuensis]|uniref:Uncharacterized protein n=1 Tax=Streptomyces yaizuensis TaxID=2989713 RepID=A0ABQ5P7S5_9ACTN|nr:hypothetical protein [Streptomyces sp. YSPA8]GLF98640.1 hypothetical protein SYYSPA8_30105 [Streptomyces sp. YSPA8]
MDVDLWDRLPDQIRAEVDSLVSAGRNVHAIALIRERVDPPTPGLHACVDLVDQRFRVVRQGPAGS